MNWFGISRWMRWFSPHLIWQIKTTEKQVFITFDDGPHPRITPWVLDLLDQYQAKATFFCIGENILKYPEVFQEISKRGHHLGNHSFAHEMGWKTPSLNYVESVKKCENLTKTKLFRPPYGKISKKQIRLLHPEFKIIMCSCLSMDYAKNLNQKKALISLEKAIQPGAIFVFHDSEKAEENLKILLPELLTLICQNGFQATTLNL